MVTGPLIRLDLTVTLKTMSGALHDNDRRRDNLELLVLRSFELTERPALGRVPCERHLLDP